MFPKFWIKQKKRFNDAHSGYNLGRLFSVDQKGDVSLRISRVWDQSHCFGLERSSAHLLINYPDRTACQSRIKLKKRYRSM
jgi:hypothetical protein